MKKGIYSWAIVALTTILLTFATTPVWAQATTDDTDDSGNFVEFIGCLFDGTEGTTGEDTAQSVVEAIEGTAQSVPTEQDIRDCFEPIYEPAATTGGTVTGQTTDEPTTGITDDESTAEQDEEDEEAGDEGVSE
jgi:hypothetical protein